MDTDGKLEIYKENKFPNLSLTGYSVTSKQSKLYNCFAGEMYGDVKQILKDPIVK